MATGQFGVAGLGVMGQNVALNIERNGFPVIAYNRSQDKAEQMREKAQGKNVHVTQSIEEFVQKLEKPRRILLMVTAGQAPTPSSTRSKRHLEPGRHHHRRRQRALPRHQPPPRRAGASRAFTSSAAASPAAKKARCGDRPSCPAATRRPTTRVAPVLEKIAAKTEDDGACVTYCRAHLGGPLRQDGPQRHRVRHHAGDLRGLRRPPQVRRPVDAGDRAKIFEEWTHSEMGGFLVEITAQSAWARATIDSGKPLVEMILDTAGQKGTGKWTAQIGARSGRADSDAVDGGRSAHPVRAETAARGSLESSRGPQENVQRRPREARRRCCSTRCIWRRSPATRRAWR